jgi:hypothetical protein
MQLNFQAMNRKELRAYVLQHRDDRLAFRAFIDRLLAAPSRVTYPAPTSVEDLQHFPDLIADLRRQREQE